METLRTEYRIEGELTGGLWWPMGELASKPVERTYARTGHGRPFVAEADTLADMVDDLMRHEDGDFSTAATLSGVLVVERIGPRGRRERWFDLASLPSIAAYTAPVGGA